jgi:hypothetical protein
MSRHARGRRTVPRPLRRSTTKHLRRWRVLPSLRSLANSFGYPRVMVALLAVVVAVLMILPGAGAGVDGRRQEIGSAAVSRPATTRKPRKAKPTTTLLATTSSVQATTTTTTTTATVTQSIGAGAAGLTSKPGPSPEISCPAGYSGENQRQRGRYRVLSACRSAHPSHRVS